MNDVKIQTRQLSGNKWSCVKNQKVDICYLPLKIPFTVSKTKLSKFEQKNRQFPEKEKEIN